MSSLHCVFLRDAAENGASEAKRGAATVTGVGPVAQPKSVSASLGRCIVWFQRV